MDLSLETLSRDFSDGQLADTDSCIVRGPRSNAKTCAIEPFQHETFFVILCLIIFVCLSLSLSLFVSIFLFLFFIFRSHVLFLISVFLSFLLSCSEVEQSCDASLVRGVSVMSPTTFIFIFLLVYLLLFLGFTQASMKTCTVELFEHVTPEQKNAGGHA